MEGNKKEPTKKSMPMPLKLVLCFLVAFHVFSLIAFLRLGIGASSQREFFLSALRAFLPLCIAINLLLGTPGSIGLSLLFFLGYPLVLASKYVWDPARWLALGKFGRVEELLRGAVFVLMAFMVTLPKSRDYLSCLRLKKITGSPKSTSGGK